MEASFWDGYNREFDEVVGELALLPFLDAVTDATVANDTDTVAPATDAHDTVANNTVAHGTDAVANDTVAHATVAHDTVANDTVAHGIDATRLAETLPAGAGVGFGRIIALYYRFSTSHQIHSDIRYLYF